MSDLENKTGEYAGKAKETAGKATGDSQLEGEGKGDQMKSQAKGMADNAKEKADSAKEKIKGMFKS
ncbi:CsbD family protein [Actinomadura gamaensis]|uniref:CsbD family protein n=1 Tax=Actinomadura gamaensis TaxID=1763541 RepID=A0ABV9U948_9ACTN